MEQTPKYHPEKPLNDDEFKFRLKKLMCESESFTPMLDVETAEIMIEKWSEITQGAQQKFANFVSLFAPSKIVCLTINLCVTA